MINTEDPVDELMLSTAQDQQMQDEEVINMEDSLDLSVDQPLRPQPTELVTIGAPPNTVAGKFTFGLGNTDFIHSVQMLILSKQSNPSSPIDLVPSEPFQALGNLPSHTIETLIRRIVVLTCVYEGFDKASNRCLEVLTEVTSLFIQNLCRTLKITNEISARRGDETECLIQVLEEIGFSLPSLVDQVNSWKRRRHRLSQDIISRFGPILPISEEKVKTPESESIPPTRLIVGLEDTNDNNKLTCMDQTFEEWDSMTDQEILDTC